MMLHKPAHPESLTPTTGSTHMWGVAKVAGCLMLCLCTAGPTPLPFVGNTLEVYRHDLFLFKAWASEQQHTTHSSWLLTVLQVVE
jgi:hypothetical protein